MLGITIDELLRSDEELKEKVIRDSQQLAHPKLKFLFDVVFLLGVVLLIIKISIVLLTKFTSLDIVLAGGGFLWNFGPLLLMVGAGIGSGILKEKYIKE